MKNKTKEKKCIMWIDNHTKWFDFNKTTIFKEIIKGWCSSETLRKTEKGTILYFQSFGEYRIATEEDLKKFEHIPPREEIANKLNEI